MADRRSPRTAASERCDVKEHALPSGSFGASRPTAEGREFQFAYGDSGRSGDPDGPRRLKRRLHIHQRSLSMRDQRRADDCCVAVTVH